MFLGGPVQTERGFVLHEPHMQARAKGRGIRLCLDHGPPGGGLEMTTSKDVLEALATGAGPGVYWSRWGYSAWGEGQLESELAENAWLTVGGRPGVILTPHRPTLRPACGLLGLQAWMLSPGRDTHERARRPLSPWKPPAVPAHFQTFAGILGKQPAWHGNRAAGATAPAHHPGRGRRPLCPGGRRLRIRRMAAPTGAFGDRRALHPDGAPSRTGHARCPLARAKRGLVVGVP